MKTAALTIAILALSIASLRAANQVLVVDDTGQTPGAYGVLSSAVAAAGALGTIASLLAVYVSFRTGPRLAFVLKIVGAAAAVIAAAQLWRPAGRVGILVELTVLSVGFLLLAFLTRAVTLDELKALRRAK